MIFVTFDCAVRMAVQINSNVVVRDTHLLASAIGRARHYHLYENADVFAVAAVYIDGIIRNHPFADGNKRSAIVIAGNFLKYNGWTLPTGADAKMHHVIVQFAAKAVDRQFVRGFLYGIAQARY